MQTKNASDGEFWDGNVFMVQSITHPAHYWPNVQSNTNIHRFDIFAFDGSKGDDVQGMQKTVSSLSQLISNEIDSGIPSERIVLGGFSQGAAMTLLTGLTTEFKLGGLVVMSGRLPMQKELDSVSRLLMLGL